MRNFCLGAVVCVLLSGGFAQTATPPVAPMNVYDGFETPGLSALWETSRFEAGAVRMQTMVVRAGQQSLAISVRPNDKFEAGQHGNSDSERAELMEARSLVSKQGQAYEYSFSMFFPKDFPIVPTRLVIAQWKQYCPTGVTVCDDDSPVLALRYISGTLRVTQDIGGKMTTLVEERGEFRGRWLDFKVQARFVPDETGRVQVWLDGKQIVDHVGVTANAETSATGYPNPGRFYFKMGLYRNVMVEPMTVFVDEYRKREMRADEL